MKNIWILLTKYNDVFLFILFFGISLILVLTQNDFQRTSSLNSSHSIIGKIYQEASQVTNYLQLADANKALLEENTRLRQSLDEFRLTDTSTLQFITDTAGLKRYSYLPARVINNSIRQKNNYITLSRGAQDGIKKGMGVIGPQGIVGIVLNVSPHFSTVQSLLHGDSRISAELTDSHAFGSLIWGDEFDSRRAVLRDIPNHVEVRKGEKIVTSGYSLFPPGVQIGEVIGTSTGSGESFLDITVSLSTDFHKLQYVYVVIDHFNTEKDMLESDQVSND